MVEVLLINVTYDNLQQACKFLTSLGAENRFFTGNDTDRFQENSLYVCNGVIYQTNFNCYPEEEAGVIYDMNKLYNTPQISIF